MYVRNQFVLRDPELPADTPAGGGGDAAPPVEPEFNLGAAVDDIASAMASDAGKDPAQAPAPPAGTPPAPPPPDPTKPPVDPNAPPPSSEIPFPKTWKQELNEKWAGLDPTVKAEIARREEDMHRGLEGYKADANFGRAMGEALKPYAAAIQQHNVNPVQLFSNLLNAHNTLAFAAPEQKAAFLRQIATEYGIALPAADGLDPPSTPYADAQVTALQTEVNNLKSQLAGFTQQAQTAERNRITAEIEAFAKDPANKHFDDVAGEIALLVKADPKLTLKDAYEKALYLNPVVRAKIESEKAAAAAAAKAEADRKHAEAAAKATAANASPASRPASATAATTGSIDDTLNATYKEILSRGK